MILLVGSFGLFTSCESIPDIETTISDDRLSKDVNGLLLFSMEPYSGYVTVFDRDANLINKKSYLDGEQEGVSEAYYANGKLRYSRPYKKGKKDGEHIGWFGDGKKKFHYVFQHGLNEGNHKEWYADGSLAKDFNYQSGRPFGSQKVWRRDGKIRANYVIRENGKRYGLMGIKRCTKLDGETQEIDPYLAQER